MKTEIADKNDCVNCGLDLADAEAQPIHPVQEGGSVCHYCWCDYTAECAADAGMDSHG